jgi:hypothetical protein
MAFSCARIVTYITYQPIWLSIIIMWLIHYTAKSIWFVFIYLYIKFWIICLFSSSVLKRHTMAIICIIFALHNTTCFVWLWCQPRFVLFKNKTKIGKLYSLIFQSIMVCECLNVRNTLCSAYFRFKTKIGNFSTDGLSHVKIFRSKKSLFLDQYFVWPLCSCFFLLFHKLILLFLRFEFAQDSKNFWKMDIDDVQKSICQNLFGKIRALLGVLRNFFGSRFARPYTQSLHM